MNKFATLAVFISVCLAVGSCNYGGQHGGPGYGHHRSISSYGQRGDGSAAAASSAAAAGGNDQRPVEIVAGPRYGGSEQLRPILLDSGYQGGHNEYGRGHGNIGHLVGGGSYGGHIAGGNHGGNYGGHQRGYGRPRWSVQPAGATLLYPGQNSYRRYASPPEYTKVVLPVRAAPPVAKLYLPENNYGSHGGYHNEGPKY
ncbi:chorion protein S19 [Drosophila novamexicana]|uniref:chorion protein S19 n=1 Tax=Drosophila novamexicana TaxID=47314 RepID=UPI0011E5A99C|nr:chorion protein S19 [Drosophila novamexicana]